jgi:Zn-dependent M28 family amino/carboxypeptidase
VQPGCPLHTLGAHHDHIGLQPAVDGDSIANGADDNGSASLALLEIARDRADHRVK